MLRGQSPDVPMTCVHQAVSQPDLETWVTSLHSASAALLARRRGTEELLQQLRLQSRALLRSIDLDNKMRKMAELQLSIIQELRSRRAVEAQVGRTWKTLERGGQAWKQAAVLEKVLEKS